MLLNCRLELNSSSCECYDLLIITSLQIIGSDGVYTNKKFHKCQLISF